MGCPSNDVILHDTAGARLRSATAQIGPELRCRGRKPGWNEGSRRRPKR
jgi:hypothetical protein